MIERFDLDLFQFGSRFGLEGKPGDCTENFGCPFLETRMNPLMEKTNQSIDVGLVQFFGLIGSDEHPS